MFQPHEAVQLKFAHGGAILTCPKCARHLPGRREAGTRSGSCRQYSARRRRTAGSRATSVWHPGPNWEDNRSIKPHQGGNRSIKPRHGGNRSIKPTIIDQSNHTVDNAYQTTPLTIDLPNHTKEETDQSNHTKGNQSIQHHTKATIYQSNHTIFFDNRSTKPHQGGNR